MGKAMTGAPWGIVLAGGNGVRLKALSRFISGDDRPKQFCPLFGGKTLLGMTRERIAQTIAPEKTVFVVVRDHERYYRPELRSVDQSRIVIQPCGKGITAAIVYGLLRLARLGGEDSPVALFPTDHDYADEGRFSNAVRSAFDIVHERPGWLVLLGAEADKAQVQYGWIEPGDALMNESPGPSNSGNGKSPYQVKRFLEKPSARVARELLRRGCFWNTFVVVGLVRTFLHTVARAQPGIFEAFEPLRRREASCSESELAERIYNALPPGDFCHQILSASTASLVMFPLGEAGWSDLGTPERVRLAAELRARTWTGGANSGVRNFSGGVSKWNESEVSPSFRAWLDGYRQRLGQTR
jgi:mannose-1-phosphate guanylyltransferase